jgi:hypothetical protein
MPGHRRGPRVHAQQRRRVGPSQPVEHAHPQHRLRLGDVVSVQRDHVGVIDVGVGPGLGVAPEWLLERFGGGGGAQPGVAVDVVGADRPVCDDALG